MYRSRKTVQERLGFSDYDRAIAVPEMKLAGDVGKSCGWS
jgi:hypothetical protein